MFASKKSLTQEGKVFRELNESNPTAGRKILETGSAVESLAAQGQYRKFCDNARLLSSLEGAPIRYFLTKAFIKALEVQHLMICNFLLDGGFDIHDYTIPNVLTSALKNENINDHQAKTIVEFLARFKFDFNRQEDKTFLSPLHYSVTRSFLQTTQLLISLGADVNSVAGNDLMPLNLALKVEFGRENRDEIVDLLLQSGAKETWRKSQQEHQPETVFLTSAYAPVVDSSSISTNPTATSVFQSSNNAAVSRVRFSSAMLTTQEEQVAISPNDDDNTTATTSFIGQSEDGSQLFSTG